MEVLNDIYLWLKGLDPIYLKGLTAVVSLALLFYGLKAYRFFLNLSILATSLGIVYLFYTHSPVKSLLLWFQLLMLFLVFILSLMLLFSLEKFFNFLISAAAGFLIGRLIGAIFFPSDALFTFKIGNSSFTIPYTFFLALLLAFLFGVFWRKMIIITTSLLGAFLLTYLFFTPYYLYTIIALFLIGSSYQFYKLKSPPKIKGRYFDKTLNEIRERNVRVFLGFNSLWHLSKIKKSVKREGGRVIKTYPQFGYILAELPSASITSLSKRETKIRNFYYADHEISIPRPISSSATPSSWNMEMIKTFDGETFPEKIPGTNIPFDGRGVKVGVLDTGIDKNHEALKDKVKGEVNFSSARSTEDGEGHGTHVAGIVAASSDTYPGVAPGVSLYNIKVLDDTGRGTLAGIIDGILWAIENGMDVINMSLGGLNYFCTGNCPLCRAADKAAELGVVVVVAAGNEGEEGDMTIGCPGKAKNAITVGAVDRDKKIAFFSSRGPVPDGRIKPDVVAPGVDITSCKKGGGYISLSGTSMATPHVTGAAALAVQYLKKKKGYYTVQDVKKAIENAIPLGRPPKEQGKGLINLVKMLKALR